MSISHFINKTADATFSMAIHMEQEDTSPSVARVYTYTTITVGEICNRSAEHL